jgi:hypothetical protein
MESELLVEALGSQLFGLIKIDDLPSLVGIVVIVAILGGDSNTESFIILSSFKNLVVIWVHEELSLKLPDLPPSRVSAPDLHPVGSS